jgi:hypothetical protein
MRNNYTHTSIPRYGNNCAHVEHEHVEACTLMQHIQATRIESNQASSPVLVEGLLTAFLLHLELLYRGLQQSSLSAELSREFFLHCGGHLVLSTICAVEGRGRARKKVILVG